MGVSKNKRKELTPGFQIFPAGTIVSGNLIKVDANGNLIDSGVAVEGNGSNLGTVSGVLTNGDLVQFDSHGNLIDSAIPATALAPLTLGSGAGLGALQFAHAIYSFGVDGGATGAITPASNATIPANAIMVAATVNPTTAVTSAGSATVEIGTTAGSSATSILGSTAKASLSIDALINGACTFASPVKMSAAGQVQLTVGVAALTAGVIEIFVFYLPAKNA